MPRKHSKNAGSMGREAMSYHEMNTTGFGTAEVRLGKDSLGNYDDCSLHQCTAIDPVITNKGYIFSKEAILECLLGQKKDIARKMAAYEGQIKEDERKEMDRQVEEEQGKLIAFDKQNHGGALTKDAAIARATKDGIVGQGGESNVVRTTAHLTTEFDHERMREMKAFWMPSRTPEAETRLDKPRDFTVCPASGEKLRIKDLTSVKWTCVPEGEQGKHMCPVCKKTFTNAVGLVCLGKTGDMLCEKCYVGFIKPDGVYDGKKVKEKDVIKVQKLGTGFAGGSEAKKLQAEKYYQLGMGSGLYDLRGQSTQGPSRGGLVIHN
mmetsp:Transcript_43116/g.137696  ORF Transcript_43116/g.137696 Transcript_43116/m.137696 type:complete len:321 (+) Transcript_43116:72-1034(+)